MKYLFAVILLVALASAEYKVKTSADLRKYRDECVAEQSIAAEHVEKFKKWEFPDDTTTHCYMKCVLQKFGLFDETKGFDVHNIHNQIVAGSHADHSDEMHAKIEKCADKNTQGSTACEWVYRGSMCLIGEHLYLVKKSVESHDGHDHTHEGHDHAHDGHDHAHEGHDHAHEGHENDHAHHH